jgi:hypothetical protein
MVNPFTRAWPALLCAAAAAAAAPQQDEPGPLVPVGFARADITPEGPIRLAGYGSRTAETAQVEHRLWARAMAVGGDPGPGGQAQPAVLITVELIGISSAVSDAVAADLSRRHGIDRAHVAVCATHIHTGPMIGGLLSDMFSAELPADQSARIRAYTETLTAKLEGAAEAALADRRPARLAWGQGTVAFATARRRIENGRWTGFTSDLNGPADRVFPLLRVTGPDGALRGMFISYACHNTTLRPGDNFIDPDWAGDAARRIEAAHAGATALVGLGCAGDADPGPFGRRDYVAKHGLAVATEADRLLDLPLAPLGPVTTAEYHRMALPLDHRVTRQELEARLADRNGAARYTAGRWIARIDAGEPVPAEVPFEIQTWSFGPRLVMVFFAGEMVSEYSLRLRRELDGDRLWINAYANDLPCYIASGAMFPEGGYEVKGSMNLYGWPTSLSPQVEDLVISSVHRLLPPGWERTDHLP